MSRVARGFQFPEGPAFDRAGDLYLVDVEAGVVARVAPDGQVEALARTGGRPCGLAFHQDGSLYVADTGLRAILRVRPDGTWTEVAGGFAGPNDLTFDSQGRVYFTDPHGSSEHHRIGRVLRLDTDGSVHTVMDGMAYPNGLAFGPDGTLLYVAHMRAGRIERFRLGQDGTPLGAAERFAEVSPVDQPGGADGLAFDEAGRLYVALFRHGVVRVLRPDGSPERDLPLPGQRPTNVAFGGPGRRTLYVTEVDTGAVHALPAPAPGLQLWGDLDA